MPAGDTGAKRTLTTEIQLNFDTAVNNAKDMATALSELAKAAGAVGGVIDTKALADDLDKLKTAMSSKGGKKAISAAGFDVLKEKINAGVLEAISMATVGLSNAKAFVVDIDDASVKRLGKLLGGKISDIIGNPQNSVFGNISELKLALNQTAVNKVKASLSAALSRAVSNGIDFDSIVLADGGGKEKQFVFRMKAEHMQSLVDGVRDAFFKHIASDSIIKIDGLEGELKPFKLDTEQLKGVVSKVQSALKKAEAAMNTDLAEIAKVDLIAVDMKKFRAGISETLRQAKTIADALNEIGFTKGASTKQLSELQVAMQSLHSNLINRVRGVLEDIVAQVKFPSSEESKGNFKTQMDMVSLIIKDHVSNEITEAITTLRTAFGQTQTAGANGKTVWTQSVSKFNERITNAAEQALKTVMSQGDFGFDVTSIITALNAFGNSTKEKLQSVTILAMDNLSTEIVLANQHIMTEFASSIKRVAAQAIASTDGISGADNLRLPIDELKKLISPKLQEAITLITQLSEVEPATGTEGMKIELPTTALEQANKAIQTIIQNQALEMVKQLQEREGKAFTKSEMAALDKTIYNESKKILNLIVDKTQGVIRMFIEGIGDSSFASFNKAEQKAIKDSIQEAITGTVKHMAVALQSAFQSIMTADNIGVAVKQGAGAQIITSADALLNNYTNHIIASTEQINKELLLAFRVPTSAVNVDVKRMLASQNNLKSVKELQSKMPFVEGQEGLNNLMKLNAQAAMDSFNMLVLKGIGQQVAMSRSVLKEDIVINPVHRDSFLQTLTGQMNKVMGEVLRKLTSVVGEELSTLAGQIRGTDMSSFSLGDQGLGAAVKQAAATATVAKEAKETKERKDKISMGAIEEGQGERVPRGYARFNDLSVYEKVALTTVDRVVNKFRDTGMSNVNKEELNDYLTDNYFSKVQDALAEYRNALVEGDEGGTTEFRKAMRDINLELKYIVEQFRKAKSGDVVDTKQYLRGDALAQDPLLKGKNINVDAFQNLLKKLPEFADVTIKSASTSAKSWSASILDADGNTRRLTGSLDKATGTMYQHGTALTNVLKRTKEVNLGEKIATDTRLQANLVHHDTIKTILSEVAAFKGLSVEYTNVDSKTQTWSAKIRQANGDLETLKGTINKTTGELYQHGSALTEVAKKQANLTAMTTANTTMPYSYGQMYGMDSRLAENIKKQHGFMTSVINTMRYITAGMLVGGPTMMLHSSFRANTEFEYELARAEANFVAKDPTMKQVAAQRLVAGGNLPDNRQDAEAAISVEASNLTDLASGGMRDRLQDLAVAYGVGTADTAKAFQIASRRLDDPHEALSFTREITKFRSIEEVDVEKAATGLEAVASQWGITGEMLEKTSDMLILAANISQAKIEDLLATQQRAGSIFRNNNPGMTKEDQLATSIAMSAVFVQATARTGTEAGTFYRNIMERPYRGPQAATLREISGLPQMEGVNIDPYDEDGQQRDFIEVFGGIMEANKRLGKSDRNQLISTLSNQWHIGSVGAVEMFFQDFEAQLSKIQETNEALDNLDVLDGKVSNIKPNMTAEEVLRNYIDRIKNASPETTALIQSSMMGTYKFKGQQVTSMFEGAAGNIFDELKDEFSNVATFIKGFLQAVRNNAADITDLLGVITQIGIVAGARWVIGSKVAPKLAEASQKRLADGFDSVRGGMLAQGRGLDMRRVFLERRLAQSPGTAAELAPEMAKVAAESTMFNLRLNELNRSGRGMGISDNMLKTRVDQVATTFQGATVDAALFSAEMSKLSGRAGVTEATFDALSTRMRRLHTLYAGGRMTVEKYGMETEKVQNAVLNANAAIKSKGGDVGLAMALAVSAGVDPSSLITRPTGRIGEARDAFKAGGGWGSASAYGMFLTSLGGRRGRAIRKSDGTVDTSSGGVQFEADLAEEMGGSRGETLMGSAGKGTLKFLKSVGIMAAISGGLQIAGNHMARIGMSSAEEIEMDAQKALTLLRYKENVGTSGPIKMITSFIAKHVSSGLNTLGGGNAEDMFDRAVRNTGSIEEARALLNVDAKQARMQQQRDMFKIDPSQALLFNDKGELEERKYGSLTTQEEADQLLNYIMKPINTNLELLNTSFEMDKTRRMIAGYKETSVEIIKLTNDFFSAQIDAYKSAAALVKEEMDSIEKEGGKSTDAYLSLEAKQKGLLLQAAQAQLGIRQNNLMNVNRITDDLDFRTQEVQLQTSIERGKLMLAGNKEDSPAIRQLEAQLARELNKRIEDQLPKLQAEYAKMRDENPDSEETRKIWLQILGLQAQSVDNLVKIRSALVNTLSTFNLPSGIAPMTYYDALTERGTHKSYAISRGDTNIQVTVGSVDSQDTLDKLEKAVANAVQKSNTLPDDVKRLDRAPMSPIGGGTR